MGGRGTYASGVIVPYTFETVGFVDGMKALKGIGNVHGLPAEAHSSYVYVQRLENGNVKTIRFYDKGHRPIFEVANHPEKSLDPSGANVMHYHIIDGDITKRGKAHRFTKAMKKRYGKYFKGAWNG